MAADTPTLAVAYDAISITDSECNKNAEIVLSEMGFKIKRTKSNILWLLRNLTELLYYATIKK